MCLQRLSAITGSQERGMEQMFPKRSQKKPTLLTHWSWTSSLWKYDRINFCCCLKLLNLWYFVTASLGNQYILHLQVLMLTHSLEHSLNLLTIFLDSSLKQLLPPILETFWSYLTSPKSTLLLSPFPWHPAACRCNLLVPHSITMPIRCFLPLTSSVSVKWDFYGLQWLLIHTDPCTNLKEEMG